MSLVPDYEVSSSESSTESEDDSVTDESRSVGPHLSTIGDATHKLPTPGFISSSKTENSLTTSVFTNPFIRAENAKKAVLERHVKMVSTNDNSDFLNGRKICWNYRKGRCRFGHNCKYAHDSDLQKTKEQMDAENQIQETVLCQSQPQLPQPTFQEISEIEQDKFIHSKRKRPGLMQGLVPGKKIMKNYLSQKK